MSMRSNKTNITSQCGSSSGSNNINIIPPAHVSFNINTVVIANGQQKVIEGSEISRTTEEPHMDIPITETCYDNVLSDLIRFQF